MSESIKTNNIPEQWVAYFSHIEDHPANVLMNLALVDLAPIDNLKELLLFTIQMLSADENGLFTAEEESEVLHSIQEEIIEATEKKNVIVAGIVKSNGLMNMYLYVKHGKECEELLKSVMNVHPEYSHNIEVQKDKDWNTYFDLLYPSKYELQTIENQSVLFQLDQDGDDFSKEREVDHFIYFPTEEGREQFIREVETLGYKVALKETVDHGDSYHFALQISRLNNVMPSEINEYTWELVTLGNDYGAKYDGWGCCPQNSR